MSNPDAAEFERIALRVGLDPADHDMEGMRGAYIRLRELMTRLRSDDRAKSAEPLFTFDPVSNRD